MAENGDVLEALRAKDIAVLQAIDGGATDTYEIREATTLSNREIDYSLTDKSLEEMGLVEVYRVDGSEVREVQGVEREVPNAANRVQLTDRGRAVLDELDERDRYRAISHDDLVQLVRALEDRVDQLETKFDMLEKQIKDRF